MTEPQHTHRRAVLHLLWIRLTEPSASVTNVQERRNARLLAALLLLTVIILSFGRILRSLAGVDEPPLNVAATWLNIAVLVIAYGISRTHRYRAGAVLAVTLTSTIVFLQIIYRGIATFGDLSNPAGWLVALLLLSSFFLSWRVTLVLGVAYVVGLLMLPQVVPEIRLFQVRYSVELIFALSLVIALASYLRRRDVELIQERTAELTESEDRYRMLFGAAFEGIVIHDEGIVVDVNDALQEMYGYSREEMIGMQVLTVIPPEWHKTIFEKAETNIMTYEIVGKRKDGTVFPMEVSVKRVMYHGRLLRVVAMRDITQRKQEEAERIQLITERERAQVLRQFISNASHDLRQPLTTMHTSLYLLRRKVGDENGSSRHIDTLDAQVAYLTRLLEDLFAMSRLDEPDFFMESAPLDLDQLLTRIVQEQRPGALQKGLHLEYEAAAARPVVMADHGDLRRALSHILINAVAYTHEGGRITVRTVLKDDTAVVEIEDTGIGISPEDLPRIFERFYRADLARQTETGGSGLGLAIAQKIVENHDGDIEVQSALSVGTTFRVSLPLAPQSRAGYSSHSDR